MPEDYKLHLGCTQCPKAVDQLVRKVTWPHHGNKPVAKEKGILQIHRTQKNDHEHAQFFGLFFLVWIWRTYELRCEIIVDEQVQTTCQCRCNKLEAVVSRPGNVLLIFGTTAAWRLRVGSQLKDWIYETTQWNMKSKTGWKHLHFFDATVWLDWFTNIPNSWAHGDTWARISK